MKSFKLRVLAACALALGGVGCATTSAGDFACPAPDGVTCMSATDVYNATNHRTNLEDLSGNAVGGVAEAEGDSLSFTAPPSERKVVDAGSLSFAEPEKAPVENIPLRTEAAVMRIWVAPWTDESGDLVMPGHIFTEIEGRRWTVGGAMQPASTGLFDPNRIAGDSRPASFNPDR